MPLNILPTDRVSRLKWIRAGKSMLALRVANEGSTIKEKDFQYIFNRYAILDNFENQDEKELFTEWPGAGYFL